MGLTVEAVGKNALQGGLCIQKRAPGDLVVALAGNPNVGKSTVFNGLTGLKQHTGNWPGKTVANAQGYCALGGQGFVLVDIPGCYSLLAHSAEEEVARDFLCFSGPDAVVVVCDATCLERNMNLVLQILEVTPRAVVCVNLLDEAGRKGIKIDLELLSARLGVPVVGTRARSGKGLDKILRAVRQVQHQNGPPARPDYGNEVEQAIKILQPALVPAVLQKIDLRWLALRLLEGDEGLCRSLQAGLGTDLLAHPQILEKQRVALAYLAQNGIDAQALRDRVAFCLLHKAEEVCRGAVLRQGDKDAADRRVDRLVLSRWAGLPLMFLLLLGLLWLTITGANYPSALLSRFFGWCEAGMTAFFTGTAVPEFLWRLLVQGVFRVVGWVVSVMLPPMAIFFPLFTLLEDLGYLPRVAFALDRAFKKCAACGKQCLTMCMGFGCNAAGIVGCRIIDSPRERLIAILTNNFVPCNGRFPTLITVMTMFFVPVGLAGSALSALGLALLIVFGIGMTLGVSKLLSVTILKGVPSAFTIELPPYRKPQLGQVLVRSVFDRTLFVLGRAVTVAAPAGLVIWLMANVSVGGQSLLAHTAGFLDPFARVMGLDGVILLAFILGFPANEIVIPIAVMAYTAGGTLMETENIFLLRQLLVDNGWTWVTAINVLLFSLLHWPCSTALLTVKKETGSLKWTALAGLLPTLVGVVVCALFTALARLLG